MAWHLIKRGQEFGANSEYMEFLIDSVSDILKPPTDKYSYAPSSIAHTPGWTHAYEAGPRGGWTELGGTSEDDSPWNEVQSDVRTLSASELAEKYPIGTELTCKYEYQGTQYQFPWIVLDNNRECTWEDTTTHQGLWLGAKYATAEYIEFDAPEGIVVDPSEEPTVLEGWHYWAKNGQQWYKLNSLSPGDPVPTNYEIVYRVVINDMYVIMYGNNRYKYSAIRQWLNSDAGVGEWWTSQHTGDVAPTTLNTLKGFMAGLDADFVSVVTPVAVKTKTFTPVGDGGTDITYDKFFLPSVYEVYGADPYNSGVDIEGPYFPYWKTAIGTDEPMIQSTPARIATQITDPGGSQRNAWWLRTSFSMYAGGVFMVNSTDFSYARGALGNTGVNRVELMVALPACVIS